MPKAKSKEATPKAITIVVPVYGDWESLSTCIDSLLEHVDVKQTVILVNDCGPDVEMMENNILAKIKGRANYHYYRNPQNLGFVKTCNRAVYELDKTSNDILLLNSDTKVTAGFLEEMVSVLYANPTHGCVCPRSNNATIASVPQRLRDNHPERDLDYSYAIYKKIKPELPRFLVCPVAVGFCMLIKRDLIKEYGLFDEIYGLGYSEENDFCLRINQDGYLSVMANWAYVYHLESRSFTSEKRQVLVAQNEAKMLQRYPYYYELVSAYTDRYIDPVDHFADVIAGPLKPYKVLIYISVLEGSRQDLSGVKQLIGQLLKNKDLEVTLLAEASTAANLDVTMRSRVRHLLPGTLNELFHVVYLPTRLASYEDLLAINRYCLRIVTGLNNLYPLGLNEALSAQSSARSLLLDTIWCADKVILSPEIAKALQGFLGKPYDNLAPKLDIDSDQNLTQLVDILVTPTDKLDNLRDRWLYFTRLKDYLLPLKQPTGMLYRMSQELKKAPRLHRAARRIYRKVKRS
ncbi:MAG TPA: glycosyltransferase family 2 protein [Candidatus Saccharimonadales bacterium]|nr:glycosyltransferase family 2 protein [Candidatus Saccharimonadales bacterium]